MRGSHRQVPRWTALLRLGTLALAVVLSVQTLALLAGGHFAATELDFRVSFVLYTLGAVVFPLYVYQTLRRSAPHPPLSWRRLTLLGLIAGLAVAIVSCTLPPGGRHPGDAPPSPVRLSPIRLPEVRHYLIDVAPREEIERAGLFAALGGGSVGSAASSALFMLAHLGYVQGVSFWTGLNILLTKLYLGVILYGVLRSVGLLCAVLLHGVIDLLLVQVSLPLLIHPQARLLLCALLFVGAALLLGQLTRTGQARPEEPAPVPRS